MEITPTFPDHRLDNPKRQAEYRVYQEIAQSQVPGLALYEVHASRHSPEVDFLVWLENVGCFNIEVKGGLYVLENGILFLRSNGELEQVANPIPRVRDAAFSVRDAVKDRLPGACYVIPVLLFPDMERSPEIEAWADGEMPNVVFGVDRLLERLARLEEAKTVRRPPNAQRIRLEANLFRPVGQGEVDADPVSDVPAPEAPTALHAQQVTIHHLVINLCVGPGQVPLVQDLLDVGGG